MSRRSKRDPAGSSPTSYFPSVYHLTAQILAKAAQIQDAISEGANSFLGTEFRYMVGDWQDGRC